MDRRRLVTLGAAANLDNEQIFLDDRRAADTEKVLHDAKLRFGVHFPDRLAVIDADAMEHTLGAVGIDTVSVDDGAATRSIVVAVVVLVTRRVFELPEERA